MLISTTSTGIFAAALAARLRPRTKVQIGLHGDLNDLTGSRSRHPIRRALDLHAAMHGPWRNLRFLVLEPAIRAELAIIAPAAAAVLAAWDDQDNRNTDIIAALEAPMEALRALLTSKMQRDEGAPRKPRKGTKQEAMLTLLRRPEGATIAQIIEATGWQQHTVRGFLAGLKKKGVKVETLERVRMVGPNKDGAKGSYSVYAITE